MAFVKREPGSPGLLSNYPGSEAASLAVSPISVGSGYSHGNSPLLEGPTQQVMQPTPVALYRFGTGMVVDGGEFEFGRPIYRNGSDLDGDLDGEEYDDLVPLSSRQPGQRTVRRRSSKACDQCRKSKCKCERTAPNEPCKNCVLLGTPCTSLRPSRKRGPPKGYIDAIEARLHQTEALLGIVMAAASSSFAAPESGADQTPDGDERAASLLADLRQDSLAGEILDRVDNSPYGVRGRNQKNNSAGKSKDSNEDSDKFDITSTHPSNDWQDRVLDILRKSSGSNSSPFPGSSSRPTNLRVDPSYAEKSRHPQLVSIVDEHGRSPRQRRRIDDHPAGYSQSPVFMNEVSDLRSSYRQQPTSAYTVSTGTSPVSPQYASTSSHVGTNYNGYRQSFTGNVSGADGAVRSHYDGAANGESDEDSLLNGAVGELSLNEDEQVRYHGKVSGLHLLGNRERIDHRNEGGIWRFPKARVWPPLPAESPNNTSFHRRDILSLPEIDEDKLFSQIPSHAIQITLIDAYFAFVHPSFPVIHKRKFLQAWRNGISLRDVPSSRIQDSGEPSRTQVPALLLLVMFSVAARHANQPPIRSASPASDHSDEAIPPMWDAGDNFLNLAKVILDTSYSASRPSTCQALLLLGYREVGIGAMAQAWTYIGMAIRMAQDLGMHRAADGWARISLGGKIFLEEQLQERKRIWSACMIMDKYVSTYIGRPLAIFEFDYDSKLPDEDEADETEPWLCEEGRGPIGSPSRIVSCFNASATLAGILGMIVQSIYAVKATSRRHEDSVYLEGLLDRWYLDLPDHLQYDPACPKPSVPLPHVLTLHMQYWCAILLLHRPFLRAGGSSGRTSSEAVVDGAARAFVEKSDELCGAAANHITSIVALYSENYPLHRCAVFLVYYVFTASIMHVTTMSVYPNDPQARMGLSRCMDALQSMEIVWPSAGRALVLLRGARVNLQDAYPSSRSTYGLKRPAELLLSDNSYDQPDLIDNRHQNNPQTSYADGSHSVYPQGTYLPADGLEFSNILSTSVLPQLYSTGLADDKVPVSSNSNSMDPSQTMDRRSERFPQYWNDYSAFPQLGTYALDQTHQQQMVQNQQGPIAPLYPGQQYGNSIYNNVRQ